MAEQSREDRFKGAEDKYGKLATDPETEKSVDRWEYTKRKRAQLDNGIANVVSFKDNVTKRRFTISVNATFASDNKDDTEEILADLQKTITAFLTDIHEKL
jgi:hypothetical protein